jgi:hypothetical protein
MTSFVCAWREKDRCPAPTDSRALAGLSLTTKQREEIVAAASKSGRDPAALTC